MCSIRQGSFQSEETDPTRHLFLRRRPPRAEAFRMPILAVGSAVRRTSPTQDTSTLERAGRQPSLRPHANHRTRRVPFRPHHPPPAARHQRRARQRSNGAILSMVATAPLLAHPGVTEPRHRTDAICDLAAILEQLSDRAMLSPLAARSTHRNSHSAWLNHPKRSTGCNQSRPMPQTVSGRRLPLRLNTTQRKINGLASLLSSNP